jgi:hypothetical protein
MCSASRYQGCGSIEYDCRVAVQLGDVADLGYLWFDAAGSGLRYDFRRTSKEFLAGDSGKGWQ